MEGGEGVLVVGEDFLVEFFAGPESGVFDLDVLAGLEAGEAYHAFCEVGDLDRRPHIEREDLVALRHRRGFHHEAAGLGDGHEETVDFGMCHRHRAALGDLLFEARDHAAVAA